MQGHRVGKEGVTRCWHTADIEGSQTVAISRAFAALPQAPPIILMDSFGYFAQDIRPSDPDHGFLPSPSSWHSSPACGPVLRHIWVCSCLAVCPEQVLELSVGSEPWLGVTCGCLAQCPHSEGLGHSCQGSLPSHVSEQARGTAHPQPGGASSCWWAPAAVLT